MQKLKKLPFVLAILVTLFTAACSDIDVTPRTEDDGDTPIPIKPAPSNTVSSDTVSIG
ncbi:MAG TPA: hypothetical protein VFT90_12865 [Chryseosolibacter sp.]|nr:hypothetical protein [Chryseosolibacter sp.]